MADLRPYLSFYPTEGDGGSCGGFGVDDAGGASGTPDKIGKNSGGTKLAHTS